MIRVLAGKPSVSRIATASTASVITPGTTISASICAVRSVSALAS